MRYSYSKQGFFHPLVNESIPDDAVEITDDEYRSLLDGRSKGLQIVSGSGGKPELRERPRLSDAERLAAEREGMEVSRFQARAALHNAGLLDQAEAAAQDGDAITRIAWDDAQTFRRTSQTINTIAAELSLSPEEVDDLFRAAARIEA